MTHSLTLEIPEKVYRSLVAKALKKGKRVEDIAVAELSGGQNGEVWYDPLDEFIGSISSGIGDVGTDHDKYLGENLLREMRGDNK